MRFARIPDRYQGLHAAAGMVGAVRADLTACETDRLTEQQSGILRKAERRLLGDPYVHANFSLDRIPRISRRTRNTILVSFSADGSHSRVGLFSLRNDKRGRACGGIVSYEIEPEAMRALLQRFKS